MKYFSIPLALTFGMVVINEEEMIEWIQIRFFFMSFNIFLTTWLVKRTFKLVLISDKRHLQALSYLISHWKWVVLAFLHPVKIQSYSTKWQDQFAIASFRSAKRYSSLDRLQTQAMSLDHVFPSLRCWNDLVRISLALGSIRDPFEINRHAYSSNIEINWEI